MTSPRMRKHKTNTDVFGRKLQGNVQEKFTPEELRKMRERILGVYAELTAMEEIIVDQMRGGDIAAGKTTGRTALELAGDYRAAMRKMAADYDSNVLAPLIKDDTLRAQLRSGLEQVMAAAGNIQLSTQMSEMINTDELERFAEKFKRRYSARHIIRLFSDNNIHTYQDLKIALNHKQVPINRNGMIYGDFAVLYRFLDSKGIKIFDRDYTKKEFAKLREQESSKNI